MNEGRGSKGSKGEPMKSSDNDGRNYKLIIDPALGQGKEKILRYSDCLPGGEMPSVKLVDPRPRISRFGINRRNVNLKVPDFKVDKYYVGTILPKEVTMTNLNNNINQSFLQDMCKVFGDIRTASILYHPKTKKHLGIAKVLFSSSSAAQKCIEKLNKTSKMGNIINVFADPSGEIRKKLFDELTAEKAAFRPPSPKEKLPANILEETKSAPSKPFVSTQCNGLGFPDKTASLHGGNFSGPKPPPFPPPAPLPHAFSELNLRVPGHHDSELHFTATQQENLDSVHRRNFEISANCGGGKDSSSSALGSSSEFVHGRTSQFDRFSNSSAEKSEADSCWRSRSSHSQRNSFDTRKPSDVYSRSKSQDGPEFRRLHGANENSGKGRFSGHSFNAPQAQQGGFEMKKSSSDLSSGYNRSLSVGQFPSHRHFEKQADFADEICLVPPNSLDVTLIPMANNSGFASNVQDSFQVNHCARNSVDSFEGLDSRLSIESLNSASDLGTPFLDQSSVGLPQGKDDLQGNVQSLLDSDIQGGSKPIENSNLGNFFARANGPREAPRDRLDRRKSENLDFKKSISHDVDGHANHRHGIHHYGSGRRRDRNRESSRRRNRRRRHRSKYHSSKSVEPEKPNQEDQLIMATANSEGIAMEVAERFGSSFDVGLEDPNADAELRASLESRIQALLDQSEEIAARNLRNGVRFPPPPLPPELPPPPPPLPPVEAELPPPLPPEPEPMEENGWLSISRMHDGAVFCNFGEATSDLLTSQQTARLRSSVRDDIHQLENFPHNSHFVPEVPHPSYHSYFDYNHQSVPREISQNPNLHAAYANLLASERSFWQQPQQPPPFMAVLCHDSQLRDPSAFRSVEEKFLTVLKEVTFQLKNVIVRDMQKKMVENIGFTVYEDWWKKEEYTEKVVETKPLSSSANQKAPASAVPTTSDILAVPSSAVSTVSAKPCDASAVLSSLFDNKEGSQSGCFGAIGGRTGFGGGLLGLRGVIAKMPSFRKKHPSPLPDKDHEDAEIDKSGNEEDEDAEEEEVDREEEETTFRGPRTPEQSDNEEEESSSSSSSSLGDESNLASVGVLRKMQLSRAAVVYSSSSDDSSISEDEEEREEKMEEEVEASQSSDDNEEEEEEEELKTREDQSNDDQESQAADGDKEALIENEAMELKINKSSEWKNHSEGIVNKIEFHALNFAEKEIDEKGSSALISPPHLDSSAADADVSSQVTATDFTCTEKTAEDVKSHAEGGVKISATPVHEPAAVVNEAHDVSLKNSLASLPEAGSGELVVEWLIALSLDHPYCQSLTVDPVSRSRGRHSRVRFSLPDAASDVELSDDTVSLTDSAIGLVATLPSDVVVDHNYCRPYFPVGNPVFELDSDGRSTASLERVALLSDSGEVLTVERVPDISMAVEISEISDRKRKRLSDVTNLPGSRELANILPPVVAKPEYAARSEKAESDVRDEFLSKGLDLEDLAYMKKQYEDFVQEDYPRTWVNETHWVNHPPTCDPSPPPRKKLRSSKHGDSVDHHYHVTGSARTEGYYKISSHVKSLYLRHTRAVNDELDSEQKREIASDVIKKKSQQSRDVRSESRRWQNLFATDLGDEIGDILKFNKLEIRKKQLKFARSRIHDWGLFAMEPIAEGEMVIEYVGEVVRRSVADILERRYEAVGIGSSYLFRVDHDVIIDATKHGNLSRFINHSCTPNCYAKIITVDAEKKIVIYSKSDIQVNEEITYDYKFPLEDEKIPCLCGTSGCRGTLN